MKSALHFVGFKSVHDMRYLGAVRIFGEPDSLHRRWDRRAQREIMEGDTIVFATGDSDQKPSRYNDDDSAYA